jgi:hypothetical protein
VREQPSTATIAPTTGDVPWNHNKVARLHVSHAFANVHYFCNALVTDRERRGHRRSSGDYLLVDVTSGCRDRLDDRISPILEPGIGLFVPFDFAIADVVEFAHGQFLAAKRTYTMRHSIGAD